MPKKAYKLHQNVNITNLKENIQQNSKIRNREQNIRIILKIY